VTQEDDLVDSDNNVYLSKVLLFSNGSSQVAQELRSLTETNVSSNCINTIGMFPVISRCRTSLGEICLSVWIISNAERFANFRTGYFSGASHSIILIQEDEDISNIHELLRISPQGLPVTLLKVEKNCDEDNLEELPVIYPDNFSNNEQHRTIVLQKINDLNKIDKVFSAIGLKITNDIISGEYETYSPQLNQTYNIHKLYNKRSFDKASELVSRLGYILNKDGTVEITKGEFTFTIDFYRNSVKCTMTNCLHCSRKCVHSRKLCIVEKEKGFANFGSIDNLRSLAILYAIHDGNFTRLMGDNPREDVQYQLERLKQLYLKNCVHEKNLELFPFLTKRKER
jgi:hypothetical protein